MTKLRSTGGKAFSSLMVGDSVPSSFGPSLIRNRVGR